MRKSHHMHVTNLVNNSERQRTSTAGYQSAMSSADDPRDASKEVKLTLPNKWAVSNMGAYRQHQYQNI